MKSLFFIFAFILSSNAWATQTTTIKQVDTINATGGSSLSVPSTGSTLISDTATQTLTNKTISGASNTLSSIPVSALNTGTAIGVTTGGTGLATITAGSVLVGNGTSAVNLVAPGTSGNVLTSNGSTWSSSTPSSSAPVLNGSEASPQSVTAGGGISLTGTSYVNMVFIVSNSGAVTVTATPSITVCSAAGQILYVIGESATNTVKLQDKSGLSGSALALNGSWTSGLNSVLDLICDGNGIWVEFSRQ